MCIYIISYTQIMKNNKKVQLLLKFKDVRNYTDEKYNSKTQKPYNGLCNVDDKCNIKYNSYC